MVALNLDHAVFHRAAAAAGAAHFFAELFFFGQPDADETIDHGDGLAAAAAGLASHIDTTAIFLGLARGCRRRRADRDGSHRRIRQTGTTQRRKGILRQRPSAISRYFITTRHG